MKSRDKSLHRFKAALIDIFKLTIKRMCIILKVSLEGLPMNSEKTIALSSHVLTLVLVIFVLILLFQLTFSARNLTVSAASY